MTAAAANAVAAGITIFAASGNEGYCDSIGALACISYVNSVGAVYDAIFGQNPPIGYVGCIEQASCVGFTSNCPCSTGKCYVDSTTVADKVPSYSNSAYFLTIFAPSEEAYTTDIVGAGGYSSGDYYTSFGGTSAACPYAAGAAAVLQQAARAKTGSYLTPARVKTYLVNSGDNVTDSKTAVTKPRINLGRAVAAIPDNYSLNVNISPSQGGSVSGPGINCPETCSSSFTPGTQVSLAAWENAGAGYAFAGWSGCDSSSGNMCNVTMSSSKTVTASFTKPLRDLTGTWTSCKPTCKNTRKGVKCSVRGSVNIQNIGLKYAAVSRLKYYLSDNNTFDGGDTLLKQVTIGNIKTGKSRVATLSYGFPYGVLIGGK